MAIEVKSLADGQIGPNADTVYDLYAVPTGKAAIAKSMRFFNTDTSNRTMNVYFFKASGTARQISPKDLSLAPGSLLIDDGEVTMGTGDKIQAKASSGNKIDFVISGIQRDV